MTTTSSRCAAYRSITIPPPTFERKSPNGTFCVTPDGCDPTSPRGGWTEPLLLENIGAWSSGDPIEENIAIQLAYRGCIKAIVVVEVRTNSTGALLTPANVRLGKFNTTKLRELYPGWGARTEGSGSVALSLSEQRISDLMRPATSFSRQALLDGYNGLPLPMQSLDASEDNALFRLTLDHKKTVAIDVLLELDIAYNAMA